MGPEQLAILDPDDHKLPLDLSVVVSRSQSDAVSVVRDHDVKADGTQTTVQKFSSSCLSGGEGEGQSKEVRASAIVDPVVRVKVDGEMDRT